MRVLTLLLLGLALAACSSASESMPQDDVPPPDAATTLTGLKAAAADAHLVAPLEASDLIRANPVSSSPWLICLRSASSEESKRLTIQCSSRRLMFPRAGRSSSIIARSRSTIRGRSAKPGLQRVRAVPRPIGASARESPPRCGRRFSKKGPVIGDGSQSREEMHL